MTQQSHCWAYTPRKPELEEYLTMVLNHKAKSQPRIWFYPPRLGISTKLGQWCFLSSVSTSQGPAMASLRTLLGLLGSLKFILKSSEMDQNNPLVELDSQFTSVAQSCPTLRDHMDCSMPGLPVHHQLLEFT